MLAANRANAQKSTGPRTAEGKLRSRENARRRGVIFSDDTFMPGLDPAFEKDLRDYLSLLRPASQREHGLTHTLCLAMWRLARLREYDERVWNEALCQQPPEPGRAAHTARMAAAVRHLAKHRLLPPPYFAYLARQQRVARRTWAQLVAVQKARIAAEVKRQTHSTPSCGSSIPKTEHLAAGAASPGPQPQLIENNPPLPEVRAIAAGQSFETVAREAGPENREIEPVGESQANTDRLQCGEEEVMNHLRTAAGVSVIAAVAAFAVTIPAGTEVRVRMGQTLSSDKARSGDTWDGTLASDLRAKGEVIARRGARVYGKVVTAKASGRLSDPGVLEIQLRSVQVDGREQQVRSSTVSRKGDSHTGRNVKAAGGTAAVGAIIGAIAGGGKGAAIGAGAGAAAGTAGAAATGKKDVTIRVETVLTFVIR